MFVCNFYLAMLEVEKELLVTVAETVPPELACTLYHLSGAMHLAGLQATDCSPESTPSNLSSVR